MQIRGSRQLKTVEAWYEQGIAQNNSLPSYQRLKTMVMKFLVQNVRARNFEARNERTVTGTSAKNKSRGKSVSVVRKPRDFCQWKAKGNCTKGDARSFRHAESKRGSQRAHSLLLKKKKPQTKSEGRSASKRRALLGVSPSGRDIEDRARITFT